MNAVLNEVGRLERCLQEAVDHCMAYRQYRTSEHSTFCKYGPKSTLYRILKLPEGYPLPKRQPAGSASGRYPLGLTDYTGMNDPTEGRRLLQKLETYEDEDVVGLRAKLKEVVGEIRRFQIGGQAAGANLKGAREHMTFISCFSEAKNSLDLWRLYADNGKGICLVMKPDALHDDHKKRLFTVGYQRLDLCSTLDNVLQPALLLKEYVESEERSPAERERAFRAIIEAHHLIRYLFKVDSYSIEREVRYLLRDSPVAADVSAFSPEKGVMRLATQVDDFFTPETLAEVIVGPACDLRVEAVQIALCDSGLPNVKVWKSTHPYR